MSSLYAAPLLRVHRGAVTDEGGTPLAVFRDRGATGWRGTLDAVAPGSAAGFARTVDTFDPWNRLLFTVSRDSSHVRRPVTRIVRPDGAALGTVGSGTRRGRPHYPVHDAYGTHVGDLRVVGPRTAAKGLRAIAGVLTGGTLDITDRLGTVYGRIDHERQWAPTEDRPHTVRFDPATPEPLRSLGLAAAVCLYVVRGHGS
ncbi:hypothetical protein [Actinomadura hibisca]|uniref:hypothetical protein n=1 Tax=Actinomadura hibisca TaxID=68565 RepID=UPI000835E565|nr:hypothetical protein [Actinomadura hibisca]